MFIIDENLFHFLEIFSWFSHTMVWLKFVFNFQFSHHHHYRIIECGQEKKKWKVKNFASSKIKSDRKFASLLFLLSINHQHYHIITSKTGNEFLSKIKTIIENLFSFSFDQTSSSTVLLCKSHHYELWFDKKSQLSDPIFHYFFLPVTNNNNNKLEIIIRAKGERCEKKCKKSTKFLLLLIVNLFGIYTHHKIETYWLKRMADDDDDGGGHAKMNEWMNKSCLSGGTQKNKHKWPCPS